MLPISSLISQFIIPFSPMLAPSFQQKDPLMRNLTSETGSSSPLFLSLKVFVFPGALLFPDFPLPLEGS